MNGWVDKLHNALTKLKIPALAFALWACYEVHYVVRQVFGEVAAITASVASALGVVFALPALAAAMLRWRRGDKFYRREKDKDGE